jgi:hypothetical protein
MILVLKIVNLKPTTWNANIAVSLLEYTWITVQFLVFVNYLGMTEQGHIFNIARNGGSRMIHEEKQLEVIEKVLHECENYIFKEEIASKILTALRELESEKLDLKFEIGSYDGEKWFLFYEDGSTKIIMQDEYGFDVKKIVEDFK